MSESETLSVRSEELEMGDDVDIDAFNGETAGVEKSVLRTNDQEIDSKEVSGREAF